MPHSLITRLTNLVVLCLAVAWLVHAPDWEPLIAVVVAFVAQVAQEIAAEASKKQEHDTALYAEFLATLPFDGSISFLKDAEMSGPFRMERLRHLDRFQDNWGDARHSFLDARLEALLQQLRTRCSEYRHLIMIETFPCEGATGERDFRWHAVPAEWQATQPERFSKVVEDLHHLADEVVKAHQALVRAAERSLGKVTPAPRAPSEPNEPKPEGV